MSRKLLYSVLFFSFLLSMNFWFGWQGRARYLNVVIVVLLTFIISTNKIKLNYSRKNIGMVIIVSIAYLLSVGIRLQFPITFWTFFIIICLNDYDKIRCLDFITKWFGYLIVPCIIVYGLHFVIDLPSFGIMRADNSTWAIREGVRLYENHIFYMNNATYTGRFNGPFMEPGHLGMISAFLLFVNHFDFKKKGMWFILVALGLSLSLAGYVLLFIGFLMILFYQKKIKLQSLIGYSLLFFAFYLFAIYYNGGDNVLNERILYRLEPDEERGFIGNNRVHGQIPLYYARLWNNLHTLLWGYSSETMEMLANNGSRGTGYIMWMCRHGIIGTIAVAAMYAFYALRSSAKRFSILCLIFVAFMFWQRSYPFWTSWFICFIYGIVAEETRLKETLNK